MYHANQPNRRQLAAEAEARKVRERREREDRAAMVADATHNLAHIERCQKRDAVRSQVGIPLLASVTDKRDAYAAELRERINAAPAAGVVERVAAYTQTYSEQSLGQCHRIAQAIAEYVASGQPVNISDPPLSADDFAAFMRRREAKPMIDRVRQIYTTALMSGLLSAADLTRLEHADMALVQTAEAAVYAGMESATGRRASAEASKSWQNEPRSDEPMTGRDDAFVGPADSVDPRVPRRDATWGVR